MQNEVKYQNARLHAKDKKKKAGNLKSEVLNSKLKLFYTLKMDRERRKFLQIS